MFLSCVVTLMAIVSVSGIPVDNTNCISSCAGQRNGDYQSCAGCNVYATCSNGILYDNRPCPANLVWDDIKKRCDWTSDTCVVDRCSNPDLNRCDPTGGLCQNTEAGTYTCICKNGYTGNGVNCTEIEPRYSCLDVVKEIPNAKDGLYTLHNSAEETYEVWCEFYSTHIYTYLSPTSVTLLSSLNITDLYNNYSEVLIRHLNKQGIQRDVRYGQITAYKEIDMSIQYNSSSGYNPIRNIKMNPYLYVGLLAKTRIDHRNAREGYSVNGNDHIFTNCDGNPNNYFALLYNKANAPYNRYYTRVPYMEKWINGAVAVPSYRYLPEYFFTQFEMHMGGCGGYITTEHLPELTGVTIGLRYDTDKCSNPGLNNCDPKAGICQNTAPGEFKCTCKDGYTGNGVTCKRIQPLSSCLDVVKEIPNAKDGLYTLHNSAEETYEVWCEFYSTHIYTYLSPTSVTSLSSLNIDDLYNNYSEVLIRHLNKQGIQKEVRYGQITAYKEIDMSIQYNSSSGYNPIRNIKMNPYLYVGLLAKARIDHRNAREGYSVNGNDHIFTNCDGNPNNYFALLYNKVNAPYNRYYSRVPYMEKWINGAVAVPSYRYLPEYFFTQFEMHMGGCGGYITTEHLPELTGVTIGLRYDRY